MFIRILDKEIWWYQCGIKDLEDNQVWCHQEEDKDNNLDLKIKDKLTGHKDNSDNNNNLVEYNHTMQICNKVFHNNLWDSLKEEEEFHLTNNNKVSCLKELILNSLWVEDNHSSLKMLKCLKFREYNPNNFKHNQNHKFKDPLNSTTIHKLRIICKSSHLCLFLTKDKYWVPSCWVLYKKNLK